MTIQMPQAWEITTGSPDVIIAIVDSGVDVNHPDLTGKIWNNPGEIGADSVGGDKRNNGRDDDGDGYVDDWQGWNAIGDNGKVQDENGHGTAVTGVAAASTNNRQGIAGVAWRASIMPLKALDGRGYGSYSDVAKSVIFAADHGARIINLSLGESVPGVLLEAAINYAYSRGVSVVAAAGIARLNYPAAYKHVIAVGASDAQNQLDLASRLDILAPGIGIYTTAPGGGYTQLNGTSMAAAEVSGVAALLASQPQYDSPDLIRQVLVSSSLSLPGRKAGLLQAYNALTNSRAVDVITPTPTALPTEMVIRGPAVMPAVATPVSPPPAPTDVPISTDPHVNYTASTDSCAACHRSHTASGPIVRESWPEERVCFTCHSAGGSGTNIQAAFTNYTNTASNIYVHDVTASNGTHFAGESTGAAFANRHVECEDCHDPHDATRGPASAPMLPRELTSVSGVDPVWTAPGSPAGYNWLAQATREYQVCFKCHSSFTTLSNYAPSGLNKLTSTNTSQVPDGRDLAQEFNPNNGSFHPVAAQGRNQSMSAGSFVSGWSQSSLVYCSDCHDNANAATQGSGPHGSPRLHILAGTADYTTNVWRTPASGEVCFKCHDYATYVTAQTTTQTHFRSGTENWHYKHAFDLEGGQNAGCYVCHDTHGSQQLHLINFNTSVVTVNPGRNSQNAWEFNGTTGTCYISCHGESHGTGKSYTP
jgi:predicted CXXCH cytochrome family protein